MHGQTHRLVFSANTEIDRRRRRYFSSRPERFRENANEPGRTEENFFYAGLVSVWLEEQRETALCCSPGGRWVPRQQRRLASLSSAGIVGDEARVEKSLLSVIRSLRHLSRGSVGNKSTRGGMPGPRQQGRACTTPRQVRPRSAAGGRFVYTCVDSRDRWVMRRRGGGGGGYGGRGAGGAVVLPLPLDTSQKHFSAQ